MAIRVISAAQHIINMRTRMPFRYGIATLTAVPHLFLKLDVDVDGVRATGLAADGLSQKWFTKAPDVPYEREIVDMLEVIESACSLALQITESATVFGFWRQLHDAQKKWAETTAFPPLLWGFGVSLVERALIEAFCRASGITFHRALLENCLGITLADIHHQLNSYRVSDFIPERPLQAITVRHTVGLSDPLTDADIPEGERLHDGLPHSLEDNIRVYGISQFKIKLFGDPDQDVARLRAIAATVARAGGKIEGFTLDGNENYHAVQPFRDLWETLVSDKALSPFMSKLQFVEQPLHRDVSLSQEARDAFVQWDKRPAMIIDESDASVESLPQALRCGYVGTSYKNCKGVFKGIANACLVRWLNKRDPVRPYVISAEDLSNVAPVALPQDLASLSSLGIANPERNGHHYFRGLSMFPDPVQRSVVGAHADLYQWHRDGFATLQVRDGMLVVESVTSAPYGRGSDFDPSEFTPAKDWRFSSLGL